MHLELGSPGRRQLEELNQRFGWVHHMVGTAISLNPQREGMLNEPVELDRFPRVRHDLSAF
jgi:hypothetical protein